MSTWKEVMDVVDHSFGHWTGSTQDHGGVTFDGCIDHQAVKELPNTTGIAAVLGRRAFASHPLWRGGFKWFVNGFQFLDLTNKEKIVKSIRNKKRLFVFIAAVTPAELWLLFDEGGVSVHPFICTVLQKGPFEKHLNKRIPVQKVSLQKSSDKP